MVAAIVQQRNPVERNLIEERTAIDPAGEREQRVEKRGALGRVGPRDRRRPRGTVRSCDTGRTRVGRQKNIDLSPVATISGVVPEPKARVKANRRVDLASSGRGERTGGAQQRRKGDGADGKDHRDRGAEESRPLQMVACRRSSEIERRGVERGARRCRRRGTRPARLKARTRSRPFEPVACGSPGRRGFGLRPRGRERHRPGPALSSQSSPLSSGANAAQQHQPSSPGTRRGSRAQAAREDEEEQPGEAPRPLSPAFDQGQRARSRSRMTRRAWSAGDALLRMIRSAARRRPGRR